MLLCSHVGQFKGPHAAAICEKHPEQTGQGAGILEAMTRSRARSPFGEEEGPGPQPLVDPSTVVLRDNNLDIDMVFKKIKLEEWPAHSSLICSSLENTSPALFPERPGLIHLCQRAVDTWMDKPLDCLSDFRFKQLL